MGFVHSCVRFSTLYGHADISVGRPHRDQICSLNFSLTGLFFVACFYSNGHDPSVDQICGSQGPQWAVHIVLAILPFLCRFIQSLRRWYDSGLTTHLVNVGDPRPVDIKIRLMPVW